VKHAALLSGTHALFFYGNEKSTYPETKSGILQTSRLEIPYATELENNARRSDRLHVHSAGRSGSIGE